MKYIGKLWLKRSMKMTKIAEMLKLDDVKVLKSEDIVGTMNWEGVPIAVLIHLSLGDMDKAEKIRIFAHHIDENEEEDFWESIVNILKDVIKTR